MDILMPQLGETVAEGTISAWLKNIGDSVEAGEDLFQVDTDKVTMEVPATKSGVLTAIHVGAGITVPVGTVVAVVEGQDSAAKTPNRDARPLGESQAKTPLMPFEEVRTPRTSYGSRKMADGLPITPLARRLISQNALDVGAIARTVREHGGRRIAAADVRASIGRAAVAPAAETARQAPTRPAVGRGTAVPFTQIRRRAAERLAAAWRTAPHVYQAVEVDFSSVDRVRRAARQSMQEKSGVNLTFLPFVARAVCIALAEYPLVNATFENDQLFSGDAVNLGIAVDLDHKGLIVPVVRRAEGLTTAGLAGAISRLVEKARAGKIELSDLEGGTYSISNNGSFGTRFTTPIINVPQVAILSLDAVTKRPVVIETEDGSVIVPRPVGTVGQSFDHRAFDGAYSASFLRRVKTVIETRDWQADF